MFALARRLRLVEWIDEVMKWVYLTFVSQYVVISTWRTFSYSEGVMGARSGSLRISDVKATEDAIKPLRG